MPIEDAGGLAEVNDVEHKEIPLTDDLAWLRHRIGKLVEGGIYLVAGEPGIGKSTLALQICLDLGRQGIPSIYITTEQSQQELARRARQMVSKWKPEEVQSALRRVQPYEGIYDMTQLPRFLVQEVVSKNARFHGAKLIVIDSLQGHGLSASATRQYKQVYEFCRDCKSNGITTILVAHVTKRGDIAGPKTLEHNVDCILYMRKALVYRPLFVPKNRFGPAILRPIPLEMERITTALRLSPYSESVGGVARTFLGRFGGQAEAQAAVALPSYGMRGQIVAPGLPRKEIEQLLNCISQIPEMDIGELSYTIQCRLPGERIYTRLMDLPLCMALIGSYLQREIPSHHLYVGEVDLLRRVRNVPEDVILALWETIEQGEIDLPVRIFCPAETAVFARDVQGATVVACNKLEDAVYATWPEVQPK